MNSVIEQVEIETAAAEVNWTDAYRAILERELIGQPGTEDVANLKKVMAAFNPPIDLDEVRRDLDCLKEEKSLAAKFLNPDDRAKLLEAASVAGKAVEAERLDAIARMQKLQGIFDEAYGKSQSAAFDHERSFQRLRELKASNPRIFGQPAATEKDGKPRRRDTINPAALIAAGSAA